MSADAPQDSGYYDAEGYAYERRGINTVMILCIGIFAVISFYVALITTSPLFTIVLPGNEPSIGVFGFKPPGVAQPSDQLAAETIEERINILFLGLDRRFDEAEDQPYRTDSIMVLTIDPYSETAGAFSIPRDTWVDIPSPNGGVYTKTRINEAYEMGEYTYAGVFDGGPELAMETVEFNFGIPIDHWVLMDWEDFVAIINELEGIDINVPEYAYDPAYSTCHFCDEVYPVEFVPGPEHMDGDRALEYARIRKSDNDFKRIERQQLVLRAMAAKAFSTKTIFDNPLGLYSKYRSAVQTDISDLRAGGLALLFQNAMNKSQGTIRTVSMAPATYDCGAECPSGARVLFWDPDEVEALKAQVFSDVRLIEESATVTVLNGTNDLTIGSTFADEMELNGISGDKITVDEYFDLYPNTLIVDVTGTNATTVAQIKEMLGLPDSRIYSAADPNSAQFLGEGTDIVVVIGQDIELTASGGLTVAVPTDG